MINRLTYCSSGTSVKLENINGGNGALENLKLLGLFPGDKIDILDRKNGKGPVVITKNGATISIGRELASKILVETDEDITVNLSQAKVDDLLEVIRMRSNGDIRYRLLDMGLVRGVKIKVLRFAPLGDPIEIELNGFNLSLRLEEAESIDVKVLEFGMNGSRKKWWF